MKWFLLIILSLVWGSSFYLIKKGIAEFSPYAVGGLRVVIAGLCLLPLGIKSWKKIPSSLWPWLITAGLLSNFIPTFLFPLAERNMDSSIAGVLNTLVPLFVLVCGFLFFKAPIRREQLAGVFLAFFGVLILTQSSTETNAQFHIPSAALVLMATMMYALSSLIIKHKLTQVPSLTLSSVTFSFLLIPGLIAVYISGFFSDFSYASEADRNALFHVLILGLLGTAGAMILFYELIQRVSAVFASSVTYMMPIVAIAWGALDGEILNNYHYIGGALILWGIYHIRQKNKKSSPSS